MAETASPTRFVVIPAPENKAGTRTSASPITSKATAAAAACEDRWPVGRGMAREQHEQRNGVRNAVWQVKRTACVLRPRSVVLAARCLSKCLPFPLDRQQCRDGDNREQEERPWERDVVVHTCLDVASYRSEEEEGEADRCEQPYRSTA